MSALIQNGYIIGGGLEIDDSVVSASKLWSSQKISQVISNPNLLDNPWFTVNQRGLTTVTASNVYFVDRWKTYINSVVSQSYSLSNGVITIDNTSSNSSVYFTQKAETSVLDALANKTVTASVMLSDGTILSGTRTYRSGSYISNDTINVYSSSSEIIAIEVRAGKSVSIKAVKLELGTVSTLSLDTAPNYATELLKCQRYFVRLGSATVHTIVGIGMVNSTGILSWTGIDLPTDMRTTPAVTFSGTNGRGYARFFGSQTVVNYNSASTIVKSPNRLLVDFVPISGSTFTANAGGQICLAPNEFINITADL